MQNSDRVQHSSKLNNFSPSNSLATLDKKSPSSVNKLSHQQPLPTPQIHSDAQLHQKKFTHSTNRLNGEELMQISNEAMSDKSSLSSEVEPLNDVEQRYIDCECDKGFGSMSSSEPAHLSKNQLTIQNQKVIERQEMHQKEVDDLQQEVTKLKCDKLDLLRQNVVCCSKLF